MKNWLITTTLLVAVSVSPMGCVTGGSGNNWQDNVPQLKNDIFMFSKLGTRIALKEAKMSSEDVELVDGYLVALRDLLSVPGQPNFSGARNLVGQKLPSKYRVYGLTIIDVIERYLQTANLDVTEDQELILSLISAGIDGAVVAVQEFSS